MKKLIISLVMCGMLIGCSTPKLPDPGVKSLPIPANLMIPPVKMKTIPNENK